MTHSSDQGQMTWPHVLCPIHVPPDKAQTMPYSMPAAQSSRCRTQLRGRQCRRRTLSQAEAGRVCSSRLSASFSVGLSDQSWYVSTV